MTTLVLVNKKDPTSHENFGSAFLTYDTHRKVNVPQWYVDNSPTMRTETLIPLAKRLELKTSDIIVKQLTNGGFSSASYLTDDSGYSHFYDNVNSEEHLYLIEYLLNAHKSRIAEKNLLEESNDLEETPKKEGFLSKLFGKKED